MISSIDLRHIPMPQFISSEFAERHRAVRIRSTNVYPANFIAHAVLGSVMNEDYTRHIIPLKLKYMANYC